MSRYYVNTASSGGNGTSTDLTGANAAFATIAAVNAGSFVAGDTISFNRGNVWRETLVIPASGSSGAGNTVTFNDYGSGVKPIINGADLKNTAGNWTQDTSATTLTAIKSAAGSDDGHWGQNWAGFDAASNDMNFGDEGGNVYNDCIFIRIPNVTIPRGATISASTFVLRATGNKSAGTLAGRWYAVAEDNAAAPTSKADAAARSLTTAYVDWTPAAWASGNDYTSPDISAVIKEVTDRAGWTSGNAIVFYLKDNSSTAENYGHTMTRDGSATTCPRLTTTYTSASGNTWYLSSISTDPGIMVHDGTIGVRKLTKGAMASTWDYWWDDPNDRFYVYAASNPTGLATNIEVGARDNCVDSNGTSYVTFTNIDFRHSRANAISVFWGGSNHTFTTCDFYRLGKYGMQFNNGASNGTATSCTFTDWGVIDGQQYAIQAIGSSGTTGPVDVTYCTFTLTQKTNVTECMPVMSDNFGWVRTFSSNTVVGGGYMMGSALCIWQPGSSCTAITANYNTISGLSSAGIMFQGLEVNGAAPTVVCKFNAINSVCNGDVLDTEALRLRNFTAASNVTVAYNIINTTLDGTNLHHGIQVKGADGAKIYNNTITGCDDGIFVGDESGDHSTGLDIRNNLVFTNRGYGLELEASNTITTWGYNAWYNNTSGALSGKAAGTGDVTADPKTAADLNLLPSSPCRNAGTSVGETIDFAGNSIAGNPDIGAYERNIISYVDQTGGADTNDGATAATAFKTIAKINALTFLPGDSILFKRGETWREQLTVPSSGSAGSPITFGKYGTTGADPIISGSDIVTPGTSWAAVSSWSAGATYTKNASSNQNNVRNVIPANKSNVSGTKVRVTFYAGTSVNLSIVGASIGVMTANGAFDAPPTRLLFGGLNTATVTAATTLVSDELTFSFDKTVRYGINLATDNVANSMGMANIGGGDGTYHTYAGDQTMVQNPTINWSHASMTYGTLKLEIYSAQAGAWQTAATMTTEPKIVLFDGTKGQKVASVAALASARDWFWAANVLSVYAASDPDTLYTAPGIEAGQRDNAIFVNGKNYVTMTGFDLKATNAQVYSLAGNSTAVKLQNSAISYSPTGAYAGAIIWLAAGSGGGHYIDNCTIHHTGGDGITCYDLYSGAGTESYIQNCTIYNTGKFGIYHKANYWIIQNNIIHDCGTSGVANVGIDVQSEAVDSGTGQNNIIRYNKIYNIIGDTQDADGVDLDHWTTGNQLYYNLVYGCSGRGIIVYDSANASVFNNVCYGNLQDASFGATLNRAEFHLCGSASKLTTNCLVKNNIAIATAANAYAISVDSNTYDRTGLNITNNDWTATAANWYFFNATAGATLATWNALTGVGTDLNSDPVFVSTVTPDLSLQSASPCRNAGVSVGLTTDYAGNPVPASAGGVPDIGAYEYTAGAPVIGDTSAASSITADGATSGATISDTGDAPVTARGVCYGASANPTIAGSKTSDGTGTGAFVSTITGLTRKTLYHARAYATNAVGTVYGSDVQFTTLALAPTLTTTAITGVTTSAATSGGSISDTGGDAITQKGVCWGASANPTTALATKTTDGPGASDWASAITGLSAGTTYHVRAYATNDIGTSYGSDRSFDTSAVIAGGGSVSLNLGLGLS